jgi:hypothetical protein
VASPGLGDASEFGQEETTQLETIPATEKNSEIFAFD